MSEYLRHVQAAQATWQKFKGQEFNWRGASCTHALAFHLKQLGYVCEKVPAMRSQEDARVQLKRRGWDSCAAMLDAQRRPDGTALPRIAPALMWPGDVAVRHSADEGLQGVLICISQGQMMGWFDNPEANGKCCIMNMSFDQLASGWRV